MIKLLVFEPLRYNCPVKVPTTSYSSQIGDSATQAKHFTKNKSICLDQYVLWICFSKQRLSFFGKNNNKQEKIKKSIGFGFCVGKTSYELNNETIIQPCFWFQKPGFGGTSKQCDNIQHPLHPTYYLCQRHQLQVIAQGEG